MKDPQLEVRRCWCLDVTPTSFLTAAKKLPINSGYRHAGVSRHSVTGGRSPRNWASIYPKTPRLPFKDIGDVGADIFLREIQIVWEEEYPHVDRRVLEAAAKLDLGDDASALERLAANREELVRLTAALVRIELNNAYDKLARR